MKALTHAFSNSSLLKYASWAERPGDGASLDPEFFPLLIIQFNTQALYHYYRVPESRFRELISSPSAGQFYNQNIKGVFSSKRII